MNTDATKSIDEGCPSTIFTFETNEYELGEMIYVINLEDGAGKEFFVTADNRLIALTAETSEEPGQFKTIRQAKKRIDQLRPQYAAVCKLYPLELRDMEIRRDALRT